MEIETITLEGEDLAGTTVLSTLEAAARMLIQHPEAEEIAFVAAFYGVDLEVTIKRAVD